jgi:DNA helicase-2/ATP-dependent DNA helicase PcrA
VKRSAGTQLVLTHTNAGVAALKRRLTKLGVLPQQARVETITGFALRYVQSYPSTAGVSIDQPRGGDWSKIMEGAIRVLSSPVARHVLPNSFAGLYVDEYQDCNTEHHQMVLRLAEHLPTRILGDPLQAIFDFKGQTMVDWSQIDQEFRRLPDLATPWRWLGANEDLGRWLLDIRSDLEAGRTPNLDDAPIERGPNTPASQTLTCSRLRERESVVAIRQWPKDAHEVARRLGGMFTSMDEVEGNDLRALVTQIDQSTGTERALNVLGAAAHCITGVGKQLDTAIKHLREGSIPSAQDGAANAAAVRAVGKVATEDERGHIPHLLRATAALPGGVVFRSELLEDLCKVAAAGARAPDEPLEQIAWRVRDASRRHGRRVDARVVSRTLLVKGLEFDHAVVLDASDWMPFRKRSDPKNLYVAMTRGKKSLTVLGP